jgi:hypothetical protein
MSEVPGSRIQLRWIGLAASPLLLGCVGAEGRLFAEGRPHPGNDVRFESGIQGCRMQPRNLIICQEGAAGCAP